MLRASARCELYKWAVGAGGLVLVGFLSLKPGEWPWLPVIMFTTMASLAEYFDVRLANGLRISVSFGAVLPCFLLAGTLEAAWVNMVASVLGNALPRRRPLSVAVFNAGQYALCCIAAGWVYTALGGRSGAQYLGDRWEPLAGLVFTYFVINHLLVAVAVTWRDGVSPAAFWRELTGLVREAARWDGLNLLVTVPMAIAIAAVYRNPGPWAAAMVFVPVAVTGYILRLHLELQAAHRRLTVIHEVAQRLNASLDRERVLDMLLEAVRRLVDCEVCTIFLTTEGGVLQPVRVLHPYPAAFSLNCICPGEGPLGELIAQQRAALVPDAVSAGWVVPDPDDPAPPKGALIAPLAVDKELMGAIWASSSRAGGCSADELKALQILGSQAAVALANAILYRRAEELSVTDDLTGLYNHRHFMGHLREVIARAEREGRSVALLYVDLDDMGRYNDAFGHVIGDSLLQEFGRTLRSAVRETDVPTRYGGDEFGVILAGATRAEAMAVADRIREKLERHSFGGPQGPLRITASIGVAIYPEDATTETDLVRVADWAMYRAKMAGGNRVVSGLPENAPVGG